MEISLEASWVGVQRHGQDLADRLAQGFTGLLHHHALPLPLPAKLIPFEIDLLPVVPFVGGGGSARRGAAAAATDLPAAAVASFVEIGGRLGQAGSELGAAVQQLARQIPVPFVAESARRSKREAIPPQPPAAAVAVKEGEVALSVERGEDRGLVSERAGDIGPLEVAAAAAAAATGGATVGSAGVVGAAGGDGLDDEEDGFGCEIGTIGNFKKSKGTVNISATYNTRHHDLETSVIARGDLWRLESSRGGLSSGNENAPLFLVQLGPLLFVRDSTLLLPVHLSKQHLLWYGYDRKSFMDVQFPNGQLTYVAGEGITASGFFPLFGGLLQAHGKCPGETRVSFSFKSKQGTRFTPMFQWPDNSFSFGVAQDLAWKKSGLMVRPNIQVSVCPTFGGSDPGVRAEFVHSLKEELNVMCGFSCSRHPSAFTAVSLGRSKWNGQVGSSGLVITLETPLDNLARPSLTVQLNGGFEF
uniref:Uncharacterized protein n=1 Tax=Leersia perrieri TaxID=77586 RepID=A0A0D9WIY2_9ORYZ